MTNEPNPTTPDVTPSPARSALRTNSSAESDNETMWWLDKFTEEMTQPGANEVAFFARRRELKLGVGLDDDGTLNRSEFAGGSMCGCPGSCKCLFPPSCM